MKTYYDGWKFRQLKSFMVELQYVIMSRIAVSWHFFNGAYKEFITEKQHIITLLILLSVCTFSFLMDIFKEIKI